MKTFRKITAFILTAVLASGAAALTVSAIPDRWEKASSWAAGFIQNSVDYGLYPDALDGADLTKPITRAQFAAVAVKLYECISGIEVPPAPPDTFRDTNDPEVLKAYNLNIITGIDAGMFAPNDNLTREAAAEMLSRVFKKLFWEGWTLEGDAEYAEHSFDIDSVTPPADDSQISDWARKSVYFMMKYKIISGVGENKFAPKESATAEAALIISNKMFEFIINSDNGVMEEESKQESYIFGPDIIPAIPGVLGRRDCTLKTSGNYTGADGSLQAEDQEYTYKSETVTSDLSTYIKALITDYGFAPLSDISMGVIPGKAELGINSAENGKCLIMTIEYTSTGYNVKVRKTIGEIVKKET